MVYGVNGNGNINQQAPIRKCFVNPEKKVENTNPQPVFASEAKNVETKQIDRKDLNNLNKIDPATIELRKVTDAANITLADMGSRYRVTPAQVASVGNIVNKEAVPALALAGENATKSRIANPDGPFAELFSAIA